MMHTKANTYLPDTYCIAAHLSMFLAPRKCCYGLLDEGLNCHFDIFQKLGFWRLRENECKILVLGLGFRYYFLVELSYQTMKNKTKNEKTSKLESQYELICFVMDLERETDEEEEKLTFECQSHDLRVRMEREI